MQQSGRYKSGCPNESPCTAFPIWVVAKSQGTGHTAGKCWPAVPGGGPLGTLPPHNFVIYFKEGGVGTFLPLYFNFLEYTRFMQQRVQSSPMPSAPVQPQQNTQEMLSKA